MKKSEALFLIVGTNPMPNIIAISNRVEKNGKVFLISSDNKGKFSTYKIAKKIQDTLIKRFSEMNTEILQVDKNSEENIINQIKLNVSDFQGIIELNYTGGTKLMSSALYKYFKEILKSNKKQIILSYIDNIKEKFIIENNLNNKYSYLEEGINVNEFNESFNLSDIIECHCLEFKEYQSSYEKDYNDYLYGKNFEKFDSEEKLKWIKDLTLAAYIEESIEKMLEFAQKYINSSAREMLEEKIINMASEKNKLKKIKRYLVGDALEGYFNYIFNEFKYKGLIDEYIWSFKPYEDYADAEIDFIIKKGYKIITMSVTLCDGKEAKSKFYEILTRSAQIAGDESKCIFQCLYENHLELEDHIRNIEFEAKQNFNVIALDNFYNIKETLLKWI